MDWITVSRRWVPSAGIGIEVPGVPDALDFDVAAPLLCAGITTDAPLNRWAAGETKNGAPKKVAVLGLGGLGHMGVQIAVAMGSEVTVLSCTLKKEQAALDLILNTISADIPVDKYLRLLGPRGVIGRPRSPSREASAVVRLGHRWGEGVGGIEHRRHRRDPGDA